MSFVMLQIIYGYYNSTIYLEAGTHTHYTVIKIYSYNTKERLPVKVNKPVDRKRKHCTNGSNVKICQDIEWSSDRDQCRELYRRGQWDTWGREGASHFHHIAFLYAPLLGITLPRWALEAIHRGSLTLTITITLTNPNPNPNPNRPSLDCI